MNLNDLLREKEIDPKRVVVFRHRPPEPELDRMLPSLAADKPEVYNAYQQSQKPVVEKAMQGAKYVASFIRHGSGRALFVGIYSIRSWKRITLRQYWRIPANLAMREFGMKGFSKGEDRPSTLWFDLRLTSHFAPWKGKLVVGWPPPERSWWRRAHRKEYPVLSILAESALNDEMPEWDTLSLRWSQLAALPRTWQLRLRDWRGIYYIFDTSDSRGYVGSACGKDNILGRWQNYAVSGHGGNELLRRRDRDNLRFTILQILAKDTEPKEVIRSENTWKERLHTLRPFGLNEK